MIARPSFPPGPRGRPWVGQLPELARNPLAFFGALFDAYGDIVSFQGYRGERVVLLRHPREVEEVLITQSRRFLKSRDYKEGLAFLGNGLLVSDGELWLRQRRLMQPAFHRERIFGYGQIMVDYARRRAEEWRIGERRDLHEEMVSLTLEIVVRALFSAEAREEAPRVSRALSALFKEFELERRSPWYRLLARLLPLPAERRFERARQELDQIITQLIAKRREAPGEDLLSMLLALQDEEGGMSDRQLRDEVVTLYLAGHETTANLLTWTWVLLAEYPEVEARLHEELQALGKPPGPEDLPRLSYTQAVIKESLRLFPPAWVLSREAAEDVELGGYILPKGTRVLLFPYFTQRDPRWFAEPERFVPERWLREPTWPKLAYFPFGAGNRLCIGQSFALMEAPLLLATLAQRVRLVLEAPVRPYPLITLRPAGAVWVRLEPW
jgi:cytochrome P450